MTRREWMLEHHPDCVAASHGGKVKRFIEGGCKGCPHCYPDMPGTENLCAPEQDCEVCWTREVPVTGEAETAEIISDLKDID